VRTGNDFQRGWFIQLLASAWEHGGTVPADENKLWKLAGAASKEVFAAEGQSVIDEFELLTLPSGAQMLVHPWMAQHYVAQAEKYRQRCEAAEKGLAAKRAKTAESHPALRPRDDMVDRMERESEAETEAEVTKSRGEDYVAEEDP
jgi:uncharacterized protein YdaU (DUF1376 family)